METITSTNYPEANPNYNSQNWTLVVGNNSRLVLRLKAFKLETSNDVLKVVRNNYNINSIETTK